MSVSGQVVVISERNKSAHKARDIPPQTLLLYNAYSINCQYIVIHTGI